MKPKLSILICALVERRDKFALLKQHLDRQAIGKSVEILSLETERFDNGGLSVGAKRNALVKQAQGDFICFIDDDDWVSDTYIEDILNQLKTRCDVVTFKVMFSNDEDVQVPVLISRDYWNKNESHTRYRMPNHLCPVRREIALKCPFEETNFGEDTAYGMKIRSYLKIEHNIDKFLYYYRFNTVSSATHQYNPVHKLNDRSSGNHTPMIKMDVVIVSDGTNPELKKLTQKAINSIAGHSVNIIVVEKANIKYQFADTVPQPSAFNYNECLNKGARFGNAELIAFCNNDILFERNFIESVQRQIKDFDILSVKDQMGYMPSIISGHCFVMKRKSWALIGFLNESYQFWCSDNVTTEQVKKHALKEVKSNITVQHIRSSTLKTIKDQRVKHIYTNACVNQFENDYKKQVFA